MNYLKAIFWDYPQFTDARFLQRTLQDHKDKGIRNWILARFLEHGRAVDTFRYFPLDELKENRSCYTSGKQREILMELFRLPEVQRSFFLTGGTSLAVFYLSHRVSNDNVDFVYDPLSFKEKRPKIHLEHNTLLFRFSHRSTQGIYELHPQPKF